MIVITFLDLMEDFNWYVMRITGMLLGIYNGELYVLHCVGDA